MSPALRNVYIVDFVWSNLNDPSFSWICVRGKGKVIELHVSEEEWGVGLVLSRIN